MASARTQGVPKGARILKSICPELCPRGRSRPAVSVQLLMRAAFSAPKASTQEEDASPSLPTLRVL